jgi:ferrochelatase
VRPYLREFLADPRVVELPRALWLPLLYGLIAPRRAQLSAQAYARIWTKAGSPLLTGTVGLGKGLQEGISTRLHRPVPVVVAMRYGKPSIAEGLATLAAAGVTRILVFPLYPQYAAATTASTFDAVAAALRATRFIPELRFITGYHQDPDYLGAVAASIQAGFACSGKAERLIFSFHGLPERQIAGGDPYARQCQETAERLAGLLGLSTGSWLLTYQSRFGPARWLGPATDTSLRELAGQGVKRVQVACPGFAVDCLETLEEIEIRYGEVFRAAGGEALEYLPALNDSPDQVAALTAIATRHLSGW